MIEDFYGLNELEYDVEKEEKIEEHEQVSEQEESEPSLERSLSILRSENVQDICCIHIPKQVHYADFMVIGTCLSDKHLNSVFLAVNRQFKRHVKEAEREQQQPQQRAGFLRRKIGKESKWSAMDMGEIVIHLFLAEFRSFYDLETLWCCGSEHDDKFAEFLKQRQILEDRLSLFEVKEDDQDLPMMRQ